jgi:hypothetical protein
MTTSRELVLANRQAKGTKGPATFAASEAGDEEDAPSVKVTDLLAKALGTHMSGQSSARGSVSCLQVVHTENPEPKDEFEVASRISNDLQRITEPHLLVSVAKCLKERMDAVHQAAKRSK